MFSDPGSEIRPRREEGNEKREDIRRDQHQPKKKMTAMSQNVAVAD